MWICAQIGAREHYAVARALNQHGGLEELYTDFWAGKIIRRLRKPKAEARKLEEPGGRQKTESGNLEFLLKLVRSLATRFHPQLASAQVTAWNWSGLLKRQQVERRKQKSNGGHHTGFIEVGRWFGERVRKELERKWKAESRKKKSDWILFAYDTGALEALEWCKENGVKTVVDQMDPNRVEVEMVNEEAKRWPGWEKQPIEVPEEYFLRREREWELADRVVVNSEFCRGALIKQGVPAEKLVVIPLCYEPDNPESTVGGLRSTVSSLQNSAQRRLRVLFLGQVILRKGIQYLVGAARMFERENVQFDVVGPIGISEEAVKSSPRNMVFHGRANRADAGAWYQQADVFVLPTISDGFAITQLEAMAHGLPVVTTPCCGDVVSHGVDGFIVSARDPGALAKAFRQYFAEPDLLAQHSAAALVKSKQFTLQHLAANLLKLEASLVQG